MVPLALRGLLHDKIRLVISVGGVAFAVLLILVLRGILDGTVAKATVYVDRVGADLFVAQGGIDHMALFGSASVIPIEAEARARTVDGVASAGGILRFPTVLKLAGSEMAANVVGFDPSTGIGGPWSMVKGTRSLDADGVIVDASIARSQGLTLGDPLVVAGRTFQVEGLSRETNVLGGGLVFIRRDTAADLLMAPSVVSFVLVRVAPGADVAAMAARLREALPDQSVMTRRQLAANDRALLSSVFVTPVNVMAVIGLLVGMMVVGLTTYSAAAERTRDFGVLKAIGARNRYLYGVIIRQAVLTSVAGFAAGVALALLAAPLLERIVPDLGVQFRLLFTLETFGIALGMSLAAALLPVQRLAGVDPKLVFKT
jgi:putative ABC transport system permease protein